MKMKCAAAVVLLSLFSLGLSAPLSSCDDLLKPITISPHHMLGRWYYIGGSSDIPLPLKPFRNQETKNIFFDNTFGTCFSLAYDVIFENSTIKKHTLPNNLHIFLERNFRTFDTKHQYNGSVSDLKTGCPDCKVLYSNITLGRSSHRGVQLLSRRPKVSAAELQEFKKQVECLNLPEAAILDPEQGFCPD
uniref:Apolipoprotein M n=1 Tax=Poecilia formosa TaxID=48698 RepID=A0A087Y9Q0_POEFO